MSDYGEYGDFDDFDFAMEELAEELEAKTLAEVQIQSPEAPKKEA